MNWFLLLVAFSLAVFMGATASALLAMLRPEWSDRRRLLLSAGLLPAIAAAATLALILAAVAGGSAAGDTQGQAVAVIARVGGMMALLAFVGGLVGAWLRQRGSRR